MNEVRPDWVEKGRVPFLDALRAMAITMVIVEHFGFRTGGLGRVFSGHLGVTLFFIISGFLITLLLLREHQRAGHISLKGFYYRRILRIFPAYYFYMIIGLILFGMGCIVVTKTFWISALTYTMFYMPSFNSNWHVGHTWSLAVEEHFYLLWPLILTLSKPSRAWKILLIYILSTPIIRYGIWSLHQPGLDIDYCSLTQMSSIGVGCLLAFIVRGDALKGLLEVAKKHPGEVVILGVILIFFSDAACRSGKYTILLSVPVNAGACGMIIAGLLYIQNRVVWFLLNNPLAAFFGALSYSLYLWQQPFTAKPFAEILSTPWRLAGLFVVAMISYYIIEKPFLRIKDKASFSQIPH